MHIPCFRVQRSDQDPINDGRVVLLLSASLAVFAFVALDSRNCFILPHLLSLLPLKLHMRIHSIVFVGVNRGGRCCWAT